MNSMANKKIDYKSAGVDIDAGNEAVDRIKDGVKSTFTSNVLTGLGSFGSLYDLKPILEKYNHPVMVQSIDGVGTKTIIAQKLGKLTAKRFNQSIPKEISPEYSLDGLILKLKLQYFEYLM